MYAGSQIKRKENPRRFANVFSIISFFFTLDIFKAGNKQELREDDIFENMPKYKSHRTGGQLEKEWQIEVQRTNKPIIFRALLRLFGTQYFLLGAIGCFINVCTMTIKPMAVGKLVHFFTPDQTDMSIEEAYAYAALLIGSKFAFEFGRHSYVMYIDQIGIKVRSSLCSLIYRKALTVNELSSDDTSAGKVMTLISKDIDVFETAIYFGHNLWIGLLETGIMSYLIYRQIGWKSTAIGVSFCFIILPLQVWIGMITAKQRFKASDRTDKRLRLLQEIFSTIKLIKIYTWDRYFIKQGINARRNEMAKIRSIYYLKAIVMSVGFISSRVSFYICMMVYMYLGNNLTAEKAFIVISCYNMLQWVLGFSIPMNITRISESLAAMRRITTFLLAGEVAHQTRSDEGVDKIRLFIEDSTVKTNDGNIILKNINMNLKSGLIGVTGPVGSGKSTLLKLMLKDVITSSGNVEVSGSISYASQEPWIFPGTIKQNILFGEEYNANRYIKVVQICALERDIQIWPNGDSFVVIDRGLNISRGQQARVNLARAVYKKADIYLLDDSLSALDAKVSKHIFDECIRQFLEEKLCIIVTHNTTILKEAAKAFYLKSGEIFGEGTFSELQEYGIDFGESVDNVESENSQYVKDNKMCASNDEGESKYDEKTNLLEESNIETTKIYNEHHKEGAVDFDIYKLYFHCLGGFKLVPLAIIVFILAQGFTSYFDKFVSKWVDMEQNRTTHILNNTTNSPEYQYLEDNYLTTKIIYSLLIVCATIFTGAMSFSFYTLSTRASREIHAMSFKKIMGASMSFFDLNLAGTVLNRFSKDMNIVDEWLPYTLFDCLRIFFIMIGIGINITSVKIVFIIPTIIFGFILYMIKCYYIKTGRGLQRLDGITRAPMVGHLNASINGLTTIRAAGNQKLLIHQFDRHQDLNISTVYMFISSCRAFQFLMDILCGVYIAIIILSFLVFNSSETLAGQVGLAITQAYSLTGIMQWGIRQWSQMENRMTSVERVMEYTHVKQEDHSGDIPTKWPSRGKLEYRDVSMCYTSSDKPVLQNISFVIQPLEKVGVLGRTGAGKSSILSALFRLYDIKGSVLIDDIDISTINVDWVRQNVSIIPQDPTLFIGTLRSNLDPYNQYKDDELWKILKEVELTNVVNELDCPILENGANFSIGQRQLICLARAIIRNNKLLVLDEATANVDPKTDDLIQEIIARVFKNCTMLTIAHRLNTVMKCDKVMVVDAGRVVEYDTPAKLLQKPEGLFYNLAKTSGYID